MRDAANAGWGGSSQQGFQCAHVLGSHLPLSQAAGEHLRHADQLKGCRFVRGEGRRRCAFMADFGEEKALCARSEATSPHEAS